MQLHQRPGMYINYLFQQMNVDVDSSHSWPLCSPHNCSPISSICTTAPNYNKLCLATTAYVYNLCKTWRAAVHSTPWVTRCWGWLQGFLDLWLCLPRQTGRSNLPAPRVPEWLLGKFNKWWWWKLNELHRIWHYALRSCTQQYCYTIDIFLLSTWYCPEKFSFSNKNKFIWAP